MVLPFKTSNGFNFTIERERDGSYSVFNTSFGYLAGNFASVAAAQIHANKLAGL